MDGHETYLVRIWLPDRPGALGAVASRFGALKGDVLGLEIIERGGGLAIDELVISLPLDVSVDLVMKEVGAEPDVEIEDIRPLDGMVYDPQLDLLKAASILLGAETREDLAQALTEHVRRAMRCSWACVVQRDGVELAADGPRPNRRWLESFLSGSPAVPLDGDDDGYTPPLDTVWLPLPAAGLALVVGSEGVIRARERQRLAALVRIADGWFRRMKERSDLIGRSLHPSGG